MPEYDKLTIAFESGADKDLLIQYIADACRVQEMGGKVVVTEDTLRTMYSYKHDGT